MTLKDYLTTNGLKSAEFAKDIGVTVQSLYRYANGERIPTPEVMKKINEVTQGVVTANSFYK